MPLSAINEPTLLQQQPILPIDAALHLAARYQQSIREDLHRTVTRDAAAALANELDLSEKIYVSLNPSYSCGTSSSAESSTRAADVYTRLGLRTPFTHQVEAFEAIGLGKSVLISAGTGSGKTEAFLAPIVHYCEEHYTLTGIRAILVYPMNALAADQLGRLSEMLRGTRLRYGIYVGSTPESVEKLNKDDKRDRLTNTSRLFTRPEIERELPHILITNHVMMDHILTGPARGMLERSSRTLRFVVLDELHTFRGAKADHLTFLLRRLREIPESPPVMIGASATLGDDVTEAAKFGAHVMGVSDPTVIRPSDEPLKLPAPDEGRDEVSEQTIAAYEPHDLASSPLVHRIANRLRVRPVSLADLASSEAKFQNIDQPTAARIVNAALRGLGAASRASAPVLDLRVHIFLPKIGLELRRCCKCRRLSWAGARICPDCGFPAFALLRQDPDAWVGRVSGRSLSASLANSPDEEPGAFFATIHPCHKSGPDDIRFRFGPASGYDVVIIPDPEGPLSMRTLDVPPTESTIRIRNQHDEEEDDPRTVEEILRLQPPDSRRVLVFQDNREGVSRTASVFRDVFASRVYERFVGMHAAELHGGPLTEALPRLFALARSAAEQSRFPGARELWHELPFWLYRACHTCDRVVGLELEPSSGLSAIERDVLDVFLKDCAIADFLWQEDPDKAKFIFLQRYRACRQNVVYTRPEDAPASKRILGRSLSAKALFYAQLVDKYSAHAIATTIADLVSQGWLRSLQLETGKTIYVLDPAHTRVTVAGDPISYQDPDELLREHWLRGDLHSSELSADERVEVERKLKAGQSNYVVATPTLEMGIDIGDLNQVVMLGVPPAPANYAQRAGRAGRNHRDRSAFIACLCSDRNPHDAHFSRRPETMIAGAVSAPAFNPLNESVARKHLHAWLLTSCLSSRADFEAARHKQPWLDASTIDRAIELFGSAMDVREYIERRFAAALSESLALPSRDSGDNLRNWFYDSGFFPDYGFHRDEVEIRDPDAKRAKALSASVDVEERPRRTSEPIAKREMEQAYRKFRPGRILPAGGHYYRLETATEKGSYDILSDDRSPEVRSYRWLVGRDEGMDVSAEVEKVKLETTTEFRASSPFVELGKAFGYLHDPECRIRLINHGIREGDEVIPYHDHSGIFRLGYELIRNAIVFRCDNSLIGVSPAPNSFFGAAAVAMKRKWGIADDELRIFAPVSDGSKLGFVVFCDADGNANLPFRDIASRFLEVIRDVYDRTRTCKCENGCLLCLRSWFSQSLGGTITRQEAAHFAGWLLGLERLKTAPLRFPSARVSADLIGVIIKWNQHSKHLVIQMPSLRADGLSSRPEGMHQIYTNIYQALRSFWSPSCRGINLKIEGLEHLRGALTGHNDVREGRSAFQRLAFELLRYPVIEIL